LRNHARYRVIALAVFPETIGKIAAQPAFEL
jgi:hypothetical protein